MNKLSETEEKFEELRGELYSIKGEFNDMKYDDNKNHQEYSDSISGRYEKYKDNRTEIRNTENQYDAKQRKENNLILYNLIESEADNIDDKIKDDTSNLLDLLDYLQVSRIEIVKVSRLGARRENPDHARPLLVKFKNSDQKWAVLSQAKFLKESERFYAIYLAKDMTKQEMEEDIERRKELIHRRRNGENVMVKNGKIINKRKSSHQKEFVTSRHREN